MRTQVSLSPAVMCLCAFLLTACAGGNGSSSGSSGGGSTTPAAVPTVSSVSPSSITAGAGATTFTVTGANYTSTTAVQIGGALEPTTFVSSTQLTAVVPASQLSSGGALSVIATNSSGSSSSGSTVSVTVNNPAPTVSVLVPASLTIGSAATTVSVSGGGFTPATVVQVNGSARTTTFVSTTQVNVVLTAADLASAGNLTLLAANPTPGGGNSSSVTLAVNNPAPGSITLTPSTVTAGATAALTVTIAGSNFLPGSTVQVGGTNRATTFVSTTQLTFQLTVADQAAAAKLAVTVVNPAPGGGASTAATLTVMALAPTVSSIAPSSITAGAGATTFTVTGANYTSTTAVQIGGVPEPTTFVSSTQVTVVVPASQLSSGGALNVIVTDSGGSSSSGSAVTLTVNNPLPVVSVLVPASLPIGSAATAVSVSGSGFDPATVVQVNGSARSTAFVSATQVNVVLTAADLASAGTLTLLAVNPTPGGGTSSSMTLSVNNPAPGAITLTPSTVISGAATAATITVSGSNFLSGSTVQVGGTNRTTTFVSATQLTFQLTTADQATAAKLAVTVVNPGPGGGTSAAATLTVAAATPTPVLTSLSPNQFPTGSATTAVYVFGSNLQTGCIVLWNGSSLATSYFSSTYYGFYLGATVPASLLTTAGTASITVSCPTAPAVSNALTATIANPPAPTLTSISPAAGAINTTTTVTLYGTGFTSGSTVAYNGTVLSSTFGSSTSLTAVLPASSVTLPGNGSFTVTTPAPGGGTSAAVAFTAYVGIVNNSMVYNPVNGLFYVSVPSSVGAPYGNSVVSVDPATGALGTPILVGSEPDKLAITADGNFLWVALDGASAVRKVNLSAGTAGLQFSLGGNTGVYAAPPTVYALAALPGATDSVVVANSGSSYNSALAIYDSGVPRGAASTTASFAYPYALQVDGTRNEIYAGGSAYNTYTYSASGLTAKATGSASATFATYYFPEMQVAGGRTYTDFGGVYDSESGALLGTHYVSGSTTASGPTVADTTLGKVFTLDQAVNYSSTYNQIQVFNVSDFNISTSSVIPVSVVYASSSTSSYPSTLTRWGTNGLAFRTSAGLFSVRSNLVKDLSSVSADLGVALAVTGGTSTGSNSTFVATVSNGGPATSTNIALSASVPATGRLVSVTPSAGTCSSMTAVSCDLGSLASSATATITIVVQELSSGSATLTAQVSGSETDPNSANNQASQTVTVTGNTYSVTPVVSSISPAAILSGSSDTIVTVTGTNFTSGSTVMLGTAALTTSYTNSTTLSATVPAAQLANLGWSTLSVSNPAPGGGLSNTVPLTVYSVITLGVNHIVYDPYSRKIMASVGSGSSSVTGNSILPITPETATLGTAVSIGSQPTNMALTSDGQILYTILSGSQSVARFNMLTQQADYTYAVPNNSSFVGGIALRGIAAQPGTENTIALDIASFTGNAIYDFNPAAKTAAIRGQASGPYSGSCIQFLDAANLLAFDTDTSGATLDHYTVTSAGFTYYNYSQYTESTLNKFGCFKLSGGLAFANSGGVANPATTPATQIGVYPVSSLSTFSSAALLAPDTSLQRTFFLVNAAASGTSSSSVQTAIQAFDQNTFLPSSLLPLNIAATEGSTNFSGVDLIRWGQDGLAVLTSGGHIYLMRGPVVASQLLNTNTAAVLTSSSAASITHGAGNTLITLTGSNFVPGVAVTWNGSYRTTTIVDSTHLSVAIPASDLASAGSGSLVATNPGASASGTLTITVN